jgi:hypothetical protein
MVGEIPEYLRGRVDLRQQRDRVTFNVELGE